MIDFPLFVHTDIHIMFFIILLTYNIFFWIIEKEDRFFACCSLEVYSLLSIYNAVSRNFVDLLSMFSNVQ